MTTYAVSFLLWQQNHQGNPVLIEVIYPALSRCSLFLDMRGLAFSSEGWSQIYRKVSVDKTVPLYLGNKNFMTPHRYTYPLNRLKLYCIEINLFEQNKHTICGHLVAPYILVIKNFMTPPFFLSKNLWPPQHFWDPLPKKMPATPYQITLTVNWTGGYSHIWPNRDVPL